MVATIAVIAAIAEKKKFSDPSDPSDFKETTFQRLLSLPSRKSGFHMIAMIAAFADFFFLSDRSDHMETRL